MKEKLDSNSVLCCTTKPSNYAGVFFFCAGTLYNYGENIVELI